MGYLNRKQEPEFLFVRDKSAEIDYGFFAFAVMIFVVAIVERLFGSF